MALYSYTGLDSTGKSLKGQIEADSEKGAVRSLRQQSIFVMEVRELGDSGSDANLWTRSLRLLSRANPRQLVPVLSGDYVVFFRQMALMLRAGYTLVQALDATRNMQAKPRMKRAIDNMSHAIREGSSFSASMAAEKRLFSTLAINLVSIGERSGNLDTILERLAEDLERKKELQMQLLSAMFYPMIVLLISIAIVIFLVIWVIPRFAVFLTARSASLPVSTQILLDVADWLLYWGRYFGPAFLVILFLVLAAYTTQAGKKVIDRILLAVPLVGTAIQYSAMAQAGWSLALLLRSGLPILDSLRINAKALSNFAIRDSFERAAEGLLLGRVLSKSFEQKHFPPMVRHMAAVGEQSGQLDSVMNDLGAYYQQELASRVRLMSVMIEPVMIITVGILVGFVYFSMFQAVMSVSKGGM
jgi:type IV pilus assembly protein PilC